MEYEIKPSAHSGLGIKELWEHRELLYFFAWRDIKVKYKQTILGLFWVIIQPLIFLLVFGLLLGSKFSSDLPSNIPYPVFLLSGLICWNVFSSSISNAGSSMVANAGIIKKIYFPRLIIPISSILTAFVDFLIGFTFYIIAIIYFQQQINPMNFILLPIFFIQTFFVSFGIGTLFSSLSVLYRDFRYILPFFIQALMFISPILYPLHVVTSPLKYLFALNPVYAPIELFRSHLLNYKLQYDILLISCLSGILLVFLGLYVFRKTEKYFADLA